MRGDFRAAFWVCKETRDAGDSIDPNDFENPPRYTHV
jgi:hypothetical protein